MRIVSGNQQYQDPGLAFLQGYEGGQEQKAKRRQEEMERGRMMMSIQQAMGEHKAQQAKALADVNARAQMGDVQALQQQMMEAQAANMPPEAKMLQEFTGLRQRMIADGADPKALQTLDESYAGLSKQLQEAKKRQAAEGMLSDAEADAAGGLFQPEQIQDWRARMEAGESPDNISQEVMKTRYMQAQQQQATAANQEQLAQAQQLVQAAPQGYGRKEAEIILNMALSSKAAMSKDGAGARVLANIQKALLGNQQEVEEKRASEEAKRLAEYKKLEPDEQEAYRQRTAFPEPGSPRYDKYAAGLKAEKEKRYPGSTSKEGGTRSAAVDPKAVVQELMPSVKDDADLLRQLKERGVKITPTNIKAAKAAAEEWRASVSDSARR